MSDWSSDVCSSDLLARTGAWRIGPPARCFGVVHDRLKDRRLLAEDLGDVLVLDHDALEGVELDLVELAALGAESDGEQRDLRQEERRVGKGGGSTGSSRWSQYHTKKKHKKK